MTRVCSLAYDTYSKCINWFSELYLKLYLKLLKKMKKGAKSLFRKKLGGEDFFSEKITGAKIMFD